jgi:hypothetical protein
VSSGADGDEERLVEAVAYGYLLEPFIFDEVGEMVGRALASRE